MIKLGKVCSLDLLKNFRRSTARDFRIQTNVVAQRTEELAAQKEKKTEVSLREKLLVRVLTISLHSTYNNRNQARRRRQKRLKIKARKKPLLKQRRHPQRRRRMHDGRNESLSRRKKGRQSHGVWTERRIK